MKTRMLKTLLLVLAHLACVPWANAALEITVAVAEVRNATVPDEDGDYPAVIIITNNGPAVVSLFDYFLTNNPQNPTKWRFSDSRILQPGQTVRVFASGKDRAPSQGELHTNFRYRCFVNYLGLTTNDGQEIVDEKMEDGLSLIGKGAPTRCLVPSREIPDWKSKTFNDGQWRSGIFGVGYDIGTGGDTGIPVTDDLVLWYPLDIFSVDLPSGTVYDVTDPPRYHGSISGMQANAPGKVNESLQFNTNDPIVTPHDPVLSIGAGDYSMALWFKPVDLGGGSHLIAQKGTPGVSGWAIRTTALQTTLTVETGGVPLNLGFGPLIDQQWSFLAFTVDVSNREVKFYRGNCFAPTLDTRTGTLPPGFNDNNTDDLVLDAVVGTSALDEFAIWRRWLNDGDVDEVWRRGRQGVPLDDENYDDGEGGGENMPGPYEPCIDKDVEMEMYNVNSTIYIRSRFTIVGDPKMYTRMFLKFMRDDGYVICINGSEVARDLAPAGTIGGAPGLRFDSKSTANRPDLQAKNPEVLDLSSHIDLLCEGENVIAIHGLNSDKAAPRYLFDICRLCLQKDVTPVPSCIKDTNGTDFWVAFPENYAPDPTNVLEPFVCIVGNPGTTVTVEGAGLGFAETHDIGPNGQKVVMLGDLFSITENGLVEPKGVRVTASEPVSVYGASTLDYSTDAFLALPVECLGLEYIVTGFQNVHPASLSELNGSGFAIVAIADGTVVTITPSVNLTVGNVVHVAGAPFTVFLEQGETYQLNQPQSSGPGVDLTGTEIISNRPVGVFGGHRCANVFDSNSPPATNFFCDYIIEHLLPVTAWGTEYVTAPLATRTGGDTIRVLASVDGTTVMIGGVAVATLNRGEHEDFTRTAASRFSSNHPIMVTQYSNSSDVDGVTDADPFMICTQPTGNWLDSYSFCLLDSTGLGDNYVNIITTDSGRGTISVDGTLVPSGDYSPVPSSSYFFATVPVAAIGPTAHTASGPSPFGLVVYGFSEYEGYGYPGGMQFLDTQAPIIDAPSELTITCNTPDWMPGNPDCAIMPDILADHGYISDNCTPVEQLTVIQSIPPGTVLMEGEHEVTVDVFDESGNGSSLIVDVLVTPPWLAARFSPQVLAIPALRDEVWGPDADPDCDGRINLLEYALGTDPNNGICDDRVLSFEMASFPQLPYLPQDPFITMTFVRRLADSNLNYIPEFSTDGINWDSSSSAVKQVGGGVLLPGGAFERVTYRQVITNAGAPVPAFMRLRVTYDEPVIPFP